MITKFRWFQMMATTVLVLYFGMMALTVVLAMTRQSGSTGLDMAKIHQIRYDVSYNKEPSKGSKEQR